MRISDWSSDVCSSDLETLTGAGHEVVEMELGDFLKGTIRIRNAFALRDLSGYYLEWSILRNGEKTEEGRRQLEVAPDRKSVVKGKSVSVRVDLGGRRIIKQKHKKHRKEKHTKN